MAHSSLATEDSASKTATGPATTTRCCSWARSFDRDFHSTWGIPNPLEAILGNAAVPKTGKPAAAGLARTAALYVLAVHLHQVGLQRRLPA